MAPPAVNFYQIAVRTLAGEPANLVDHEDKVLLIVNVASRCGYTPQYVGLERLHREYAGRGFAVLGFPCNQFGEEEPGTPEEIGQFCSRTYGVTFPLFEKIDVNGEGRHPIYDELTRHPDATGTAGDVEWNFEKFLVAPGAASITRFRPDTEPEDVGLVEALTSILPGPPAIHPGSAATGGRRPKG
jgi:glutathione peroxidase